MREGMQWNLCCLVKPEYLLKTKEILQSTLFTKECGTLHFFFFFLLVVILQHDEYLQQYVKKDTVKSLGITA